VLCASIAAGPAQAAFPGANGKIAFVRTGADGFNYIWLIEDDGTNPVLFTQGRDPAWSPDGSKLAFARGADIWVTNADGTGEQLLMSEERTDAPAWTPDGRKITFVRYTSCDASGCDNFLRTMNADGSGVVSQRTRSNAFDPAWSPSGTKLAYVDYDWDFGLGEIVLTNPDGSGLTPFCCSPSNPAPHGPRWAPDGSALVFGYSRRIAKQNADGSGFTFLSPPGGPYENYPEWSPDGAKIAFWRDPVEGPPGGLYVMDPDGTDAVRLADGIDPSWQPIPVNAYPRPKSASPVQVSLVPAYDQCTDANRTHGPPLAFSSCNPPNQSSTQLTVGTPDANTSAAKSTAYVRVGARIGNPATPADEADVHMRGTITDVRLQSDLSDYTGDLQVRFSVQITDKNNTPHPGGPGAATVQPFTHSQPISCAATADTTVGATCQFQTTVEALIPGAVTEQRRSIWELGQITVADGAGNPFLTQGVFIP
jgi:TolB protein